MLENIKNNQLNVIKQNEKKIWWKHEPIDKLNLNSKLHLLEKTINFWIEKKNYQLIANRVFYIKKNLRFHLLVSKTKTFKWKKIKKEWIVSKPLLKKSHRKKNKKVLSLKTWKLKNKNIFKNQLLKKKLEKYINLPIIIKVKKTSLYNKIITKTKEKILAKTTFLKNKKVRTELIDCIIKSFLFKEPKILVTLIAKYLNKMKNHKQLLENFLRTILLYCFEANLPIVGVKFMVKGRINKSNRSRKFIFENGTLKKSKAPQNVKIYATHSYTKIGTFGVKALYNYKWI